MSILTLEKIAEINNCDLKHAEHIARGIIAVECVLCLKFYLAHDARGRT